MIRSPIKRALRSARTTPLTRARWGAAGPSQPLRFASPTNHTPSIAGAVTSGAYLQSLSRTPIFVGSGDMSELRLCFNGWHTASTSDFAAYPNDYSVVLAALENSAGTVSVPITFSGGRTVTVTAGSSDVQSDAILPAAFGLAKFSRGEKYWLRLRLAVASAGQSLPQGGIGYTTIGFPAAVGLWIDPATFVGSSVDGTGNIAFSAGWANNAQPYQPIVLGRFTSGDPKTFLGLGDSIVDQAGDTGTGTPVLGWSRSLIDADLVSNPLGGCRIATSGSTGAQWAAGNATRAKALLKYARYAVEEFGTNVFTTVQAASVAQSIVTPIWAALTAAGVQGIVKPLLVPRTTSTDSWATAANQTAINASWQSGGGARAYNDWIVSLVGSSLLSAPSFASVRTSSVQSSDGFYQWLTDGTANKYSADGIHPTTAGHLLQAAEYRTAYASLT